MNVDLTVPWDLADVVFIIEDKKLYVNKPILMMSSDVFRTMFTADFREKDLAEIPLPGKNFDSFLLLMKVIHPPHMEVNASNVQQLLPLSHEYGVHHVTSSCEKVLLIEPPSVQNLVLADRYSLLQLRERCVWYAHKALLTQLEAQPGFDDLQSDTMIEVLRHKVQQTELKQKPEGPKSEQQERAEVEPSKEFIYELMSKPPSVESLVLAEKYHIPQLKQVCIQYAKNKPLSELQAAPGYDKITPATLVEVFRSKVEKQEPKMIQLEPKLKSLGAILEKVHELKRGRKITTKLCSNPQSSLHPPHTVGTRYPATVQYGSCPECEKAVLRETSDLCITALEGLHNIK